MISKDSVDAMFAKMGTEKNVPITETEFYSCMVDFQKKEPNFIVYLTIYFAVSEFKDPLSAALFAVSMYERLRNSQNMSDDLKKNIQP